MLHCKLKHTLSQACHMVFIHLDDFANAIAQKANGGQSPPFFHPWVQLLSDNCCSDPLAVA
jgi:hypothetical protein